MEQVVRTIYGSALQTAMLLGIPHVVKNNSTLNQRFSVQQDAVHVETVYPRVQYFCIGNGGHRLVSGADSIPYTKAVQHRAADASPYKPYPFVLRAANLDLLPQERAKYALRRVETYNGETYFAYYLKRIPTDTLSVAMQLRIVQDGLTSSTDFEPTSANLVPVPPVVTNSGANALAAEYLTVSSLLSISLTESDCAELLDVSKIIYGDDNYAIISEIGLCSGVDKVIALADNSNFKEAIAVQVVSHVSAFHQVKFTASGITGLFDVGSSEPLLNIA